ncbi:MAG: M2 family metallopeptidase [Acidobacteriota bacterium]
MLTKTFQRTWVWIALFFLLVLPGCTSRGPTVDEAREFIEQAEQHLQELWIKAERAAWVQSTYITEDTQMLAADAYKEVLAATQDYALKARRFEGLDLPPDVARKFQILKTSLSLVAPSDPDKQAELARIGSEMEALYGSGKYCPEGEGGPCYDLQQLSQVLAESRDPKELLRAWIGWRTVSPPMRPMYQRFVELANEGARELGFADLGELWRSGYDMPPDAFAAEVERLWQEVRPLYESLHCYVRRKLAERYGSDVVPDQGPIPAHLLGNMWSQQWGNIYDIVGIPESDPGYDLTKILREKNVDELEMVRYGERFFTSLSFAPLPDTFWKRSLFTKPRDREVVCHASAWNIDAKDDLRIKMCIQVNEEDFVTIHHELGHNFYQRAYNQQPPLFQGGAHDGFHEAIGDTIALSITPEYLHEVGLLDKVPGSEGDLGLLLRMALDKVAFLPFGLLVDQWRWKVFSGAVPPDRYNAAWWELRERYQGIAPPVERSEADFDPGAKYHIPANTPYMRYFLAHILQFQFHRALCRAAGYEGPLHRCSIYGNREAGARLKAALEMGRSRPWPDVLEALTGEREMSANALLEYFAPLKQWLDEQNEGQTCGW